MKENFNVDELKVGDKVFRRPIIKITKKCIYINPTVPWGQSRFTKKEIDEHYNTMK